MGTGNIIAAALLGTGAIAVAWAFRDPDSGKFDSDVAFSNWSATHNTLCKCVPQCMTASAHGKQLAACGASFQRILHCRKVYEPESEEEVVHLMRRAIGEGWLLRVVGSGISPNALGFSDKCMISMAQMDTVISVDVNTKQVRV